MSGYRFPSDLQLRKKCIEVKILVFLTSDCVIPLELEHKYNEQQLTIKYAEEKKCLSFFELVYFHDKNVSYYYMLVL